MSMLDAVCLTYLATVSNFEIDTLVDTLVKRQASMQVKSLENTSENGESGAARHIAC